MRNTRNTKFCYCLAIGDSGQDAGLADFLRCGGGSGSGLCRRQASANIHQQPQGPASLDRSDDRYTQGDPGHGLLPFVAVKLAGNPFGDYCLSIQYT